MRKRYMHFAPLSVSAFATLMMAMLLPYQSRTGTTKAWFLNQIDSKQTVIASTNGAYYEGGSGTKDDPYIISRPFHLYNLAWLQYLGTSDYSGKSNGGRPGTGGDNTYFKIKNDIDMKGWTLPPIGTENNPFISHLDGNYKTIENLTISNNFGDFNRHPTSVTAKSFEDGSTKLVHSNDTDTTSGKVEIVGFFGVVGEYDKDGTTYSSKVPGVQNLKLEALKVNSSTENTLIGAFAGYVNGEVKNIAVNKVDLKTANNAQPISSITSHLSDYGTVGYATSSKENTDEANQFSYVGQVYNNKTEVYNPHIEHASFNAVDQGSASGWGGSIDMDSMYQSLKAKARAADWYTDKYDKVDEYNRTRNKDGSYDPEEGKGYNNTGYNATTSQQTYDEGRDEKYHDDGTYATKVATDMGKDDANKSVQTASYTFRPSDGSFNAYVGLSGRYALSSTDYTYDYNTTYREGFLLHADSEYLQLDASGTPSTANDRNQATVLYDETKTEQVTAADGTKTTITHTYLYYFPEGSSTKTYLNANRDRLSASSVPSTDWTWENNFYKTDGGYYLLDDGGTWKLSKDITHSAYYLFSYDQDAGTVYLKTDNGELTASSDISSDSHFYVDDDDYVYTLVNGERYYINLEEGYYSDDYSVELTKNKSSTCFKYESGTIYAQVQNYRRTYTYYLVWGLNYDTYNMEISPTRSRSNHFEGQIRYPSTAKDSNPKLLDKTETKTREHYTYDTYLPLQWDKDKKTNPAENNTGYLIAGRNYFPDSNVDSDNIGDVRFSSQYNASNMLKYSGYSSNPGTNYNSFAPFTIQNGVAYRIKDPLNENTIDSLSVPSGKEAPNTADYTKLGVDNKGLKKYYIQNGSSVSGTRIAMGNLFHKWGGGNTYGLHFMNIQQQNNITVPYAKINGKEYTNYQLPEDSFDFNLAKAGYVNFMAHTAYLNGTEGSPVWSNTNNCFFSLKTILRDPHDPTKINDIKEIAKIYKNDDPNTKKEAPYVYTYRKSLYGGLYQDEDPNNYDTGVTNATTGAIIQGTKGTQVFDTFDLTDPDKKNFFVYSTYYFEVPINKGEYALGSVGGKTMKAKGWRSYLKNGAYLMYLDIGANAETIDRSTIYEKMMETNSYYTFPKGIAVSESVLSTGYTADQLHDFERNTVGFTIDSALATALNITRTGDNVTVKDLKNNKANFKGKDITSLKEGTTELSVKPVSTQTKTTERMTYFDTFSSDGKQTKTVVTKEIGFDGKEKDTVEKFVKGDTDYEKESTETTAYVVYKTSDGTSIAETELSKILTPLVEGYNFSDTDGFVLTFSYQTDEGVTVTNSYLLNVTTGETQPSDAESGTYVTSIDGYTITVETDEKHKTTRISVSAKKEASGSNMKITINGTEIQSGETVVVINP